LSVLVRLAMLPILVVLAGLAPEWLRGWPAGLPVLLLVFATCVSPCRVVVALFRRAWRAATIEAAIGALTFVAMWLGIFNMLSAWHGDTGGRAALLVVIAFMTMLRFARDAALAAGLALLLLFIGWLALRCVARARGPGP